MLLETSSDRDNSASSFSLPSQHGWDVKKNVESSMEESDCSDHSFGEEDEIEKYCFREQLLDELEGVTSTTKSSGRQQRSRCWSHREDFFADSPYFSACVKREMHNDRIFADIIKDLAEDVKVLTKAGTRMANATRRLSTSCQFWGQNDASEEREEAAEIKQKVLGARICSLLGGLGKSLEEVAIAQENMCTVIEETIGRSFVEDVDNDLNTAKRLQRGATSKTDSAEQGLAKYINVGTSALSMGSSRNMMSDLEASSDELNTKERLHRINVSQAAAEISRFHLIQHLVKAQDERKLKFCKMIGKIGYTLHNDLQKCTNVLRSLEPRAKHIEKDMVVAYSSYFSRWQDRNKLLNYTLNKIEATSLNNSDNSLTADITTDDINGLQSLQHKAPAAVERETNFWDMPNILAASARYRRPRPEGVRLESWLYKKTSSFLLGERWERQWFMLKDGALHIVHPSNDDREMFTKEKVCDIVLSTVRDLDNSNDDVDSMTRFCFELRSPTEKQPITLKARSPDEFKLWVNGIRSYIEEELIQGDPHSRHLNNCIGKDYRVKSTEVFDAILDTSIRDDSEAFELSSSIRSYASECLGPSHTNPNNKYNPLAQQVMEANTFCAECGKAGPDWVSLNLGILVCLNCSGVHRSLGVHVSKVRSLSLDSLTDLEARLFLALGNKRMNQVWEEKYNNMSSHDEIKPNADSDTKERENWIINKYIAKKFLCKTRSDKKISHNEELFKAAKNGDAFGIAKSIAYGGDVNWKNPEDGGATALQVCLAGLQHSSSEKTKSQRQYPECVELLLQNGSTYSMLDNNKA